MNFLFSLFLFFLLRTVFSPANPWRGVSFDAKHVLRLAYHFAPQKTPHEMDSGHADFDFLTHTNPGSLHKHELCVALHYLELIVI